MAKSIAVKLGLAVLLVAGFFVIAIADRYFIRPTYLSWLGPVGGSWQALAALLVFLAWAVGQIPLKRAIVGKSEGQRRRMNFVRYGGLSAIGTLFVLALDAFLLVTAGLPIIVLWLILAAVGIFYLLTFLAIVTLAAVQVRRTS